MTKRRPWVKAKFFFRLAAAALLIGVVFLPHSAGAHPHVFIENRIKLVFDEQGLAGVRVLWTFDRAFSAFLRNDYDYNGDDELTGEEIQGLEADYKQWLKDFTYIEIDGEKMTDKSIRNFSLDMVLGADMELRCFIPCRVRATEKERAVWVTQFDPSYYAAFEEGDPAAELEGPVVPGARLSVNEVKKDSDYGPLSPLQAELRFQKPQIAAPAPGDESAASSGSVFLSRAQEATTVTLTPHSVPPGRRSRRGGSYLKRIARLQKRLQDKMTSLIGDSEESGSASAFITLALISFLYGVVHAAGPGHGKAVASMYAVSRGSRYSAALALGFCVAFFHGLTGVAAVLVLKFIAQKSAGGGLESASGFTQSLSFFLIALLGVALFAGNLRAFIKLRTGGAGHTDKKADEGAIDENAPAASGNRKRSLLPMIIALGIVPCPGVVFIMLFCVSAGATLLGILLALFQMTGMALTISAVAFLAMAGKRLSFRPLKKRRIPIDVIEAVIGSAGGAIIAVLGLLFFLASFQA